MDDSDSGDRDSAPPPPPPPPSRIGGPDQWTEKLVKAAMSKEPIPVPPFEYANQDEFDTCLTPRQALQTFPFDESLAITQLHRELDVRRVVAIAELAIWRTDDQVSQAPFLIVPRWVWRHDLRPDDDFWNTGYLLVTFPTKGYATTDYDRWIKLFDVRFWPAGLVKTAPEALASPSQDRVAPLPEAEQRRFCELYLATWGDRAVEGKALAAALACYPDKKISRDPFFAIFRELRGPGKRGRPPIREE